MMLSIIVAAAENGVIGKDGGMPWRISADLKVFRKLTMGKPMIMGRRTFESIGKPLDGRDTIVVTSDPNFDVPGVSVCATVADAVTLARVLARTRGEEEIMVVGGAQVYACILADVDRIYFTRVHGHPEGDCCFEIPDPENWQEVAREALPRGPRDDFDATLIVYDRIAPVAA